MPTPRSWGNGIETDVVFVFAKGSEYFYYHDKLGKIIFYFNMGLIILVKQQITLPLKIYFHLKFGLEFDKKLFRKCSSYISTPKFECQRYFNGQKCFMTPSMEVMLYDDECYHGKNKVRHYLI